ncbi:MAG: nucleotidyltransferase domain-containing protein [Proteobacteria bacterium]|nr:nucleotidyltransferase domain-containing protein [Pseudomonadota bacterium]
MILTSIDETLNLLKIILKDNLIGVYLFGSAVINGLQKYSDIDLFVVTNRPTNFEEKHFLWYNWLHIVNFRKVIFLIKNGLFLKSSMV